MKESAPHPEFNIQQSSIVFIRVVA